MKPVKIFVAALVSVLSLAGCASGGPKTILIENSMAPEKAAILHPTTVPGGLMLIRQVDGRSTYALSIGYFGSLYVPPGERQFEVEVSHSFTIQDAGGPAWTAPQGANISPVVGEHGGGLLVVKGVSKPKGKVLPGKIYEIKFGFDRSIQDKPVPVTWVSEVSGT
ncbi:MAG: hypothetical protein V4857_18900 [Pseudomonadota bacterium]